MLQSQRNLEMQICQKLGSGWFLAFQISKRSKCVLIKRLVELYLFSIYIVAFPLRLCLCKENHFKKKLQIHYIKEEKNLYAGLRSLLKILYEWMYQINQRRSIVQAILEIIYYRNSISDVIDDVEMTNWCNIFLCHFNMSKT